MRSRRPRGRGPNVKGGERRRQVMTILEHPEAQALLEDAVLGVEQLQELAQRLKPFLERYLPLFQRSEQRAHAEHILQGKLSGLSRKTCEPIANLLDCLANR